MKPMLERKRRARINRCLDELKELMSAALSSEGENLTKLEKADVLELTVRHLHKLRERQALGLSPVASASATYADKFRAGFTHCAAEVSRYLATSAGLDVTVGQHLLSHLGRCVHQLEANTAAVAATTAAASTPSPSATSTPLAHSRFPFFGASTYTPPTSPTMSINVPSHQLHQQPHHQQQQQQRSSSSSPLLSPVSSPALSETESMACDYTTNGSRYSMHVHQDSVMYSTSPTATAAADNGNVWRPW